MDRYDFDAIVRVFATHQSRRATVAALLGAALLGRTLESDAKHGKGKQQAKDRADHDRKSSRRTRRTPSYHDNDHGNGKNRGKPSHDQDGRRNQRGEKGRISAASPVCFGGSPCQPGPGANLKGCDFGSSPVLRSRDLRRANLASANLRDADVSAADLRNANLGKACLVDAILRSVRTDSATNWSGALYCRTIMPDGSTNNSGCTLGTACCPVCDAAHPCPGGQVCCDGRCRAGDCCTDAQCPDPAKPICRNNRCAPCTTSQQCGTGKVCCGGQCKSGNCCQDGDCANRQDRPCQRRSCDLTTNTCVSTPVADGTSCDDGDACTLDDGCQAGTCVPGSVKDCSGESDLCNDGVCRAADGVCIKQPKSNGTSCNADNDNCTVGDSCQNGVCTPGAGLDCRGLEDQCNRGVCQSNGACGKEPKADDTPCLADGNFCNVVGACRNGTCVAGAALTCAASDACHTAGVCDPSTGRCSNPLAPDGTRCGGNGICRNGVCTETCVPVNAVCDPATDICCDNEGEVCSDTAACAAAGDPGRCCRDEGAFCTHRCDCCNGVCANGACCRPGQQCNSANDCCEGEECIDTVCTAVCGANNALCGTGPGEGCCSGFRCVNGECFPETCTAPTAHCSSASQCCPAGVITCEPAFNSNGPICCHPQAAGCAATSECCGINICGAGSRCCRPTFGDPDRGGETARGCIGREHECCPGTRCNPRSNFCCVEEGQPVPANAAGFLDCCHFAARDGVCICHQDGETCSAPSGNPFLSTCCDGLICVDNVCQPPCAPWTTGGGCSAQFPCCRGKRCEDFVCTS